MMSTNCGWSKIKHDTVVHSWWIRDPLSSCFGNHREIMLERLSTKYQIWWPSSIRSCGMSSKIYYVCLFQETSRTWTKTRYECRPAHSWNCMTTTIRSLIKTFGGHVSYHEASVKVKRRTNRPRHSLLYSISCLSYYIEVFHQELLFSSVVYKPGSSKFNTYHV